MKSKFVKCTSCSSEITSDKCELATYSLLTLQLLMEKNILSAVRIVPKIISLIRPTDFFLFLFKKILVFNSTYITSLYLYC